MHISPEDRHELISARFGTVGHLADLTQDNFLAIGLGVSNLRGVEFCHFPISKWSPLTHSL